MAKKAAERAALEPVPAEPEVKVEEVEEATSKYTEPYDSFDSSVTPYIPYEEELEDEPEEDSTLQESKDEEAADPPKRKYTKKKKDVVEDKEEYDEDPYKFDL
jgi:hypothetical protein